MRLGEHFGSFEPIKSHTLTQKGGKNKKKDKTKVREVKSEWRKERKWKREKQRNMVLAS